MLAAVVCRPQKERQSNGKLKCGLKISRFVLTLPRNAYDAGSVIYNKNGEIIGACNYAYGQVARICGKLQNVVVVYSCENHITGELFVDKYGLDI